MTETDDHFRSFAGALEREIARCGETEDWFARQKDQMTRLLALETQFRALLIAHREGDYCYRRFIEFICDEQRNILDARPYFRERQGVFASEISGALKNREVTLLHKFGINYRFILFVMQARVWSPRSNLRRIFDEITALRQEIITMNAPLAINRAGIFFRRTPRSHLAQMDLIGIAVEGLMSGIDKYTPDDETSINTRQFRSTALGRMTGDMIAEYSQTLIHFYPVDKRKIYRANKLLVRNVGAVDLDKLAAGVNLIVKRGEGAKASDHPTTADEIGGLISAASTVSSDSTTASDPDAPEPVERFAAPEATRPDLQVEEHNAMTVMQAALRHLSVYQRKVLRLKGVRGGLGSYRVT